ncbi:hypothetical protein OsJ_18702 [Oryza sativa Japonica Group]|uniref:Uncharacterized protein n=1 Tax=Oryza sativa subsp. japonica TaxID=39947 RepID=B9FPU3_ORYSJ|nr:hypothetical protein OsJ_18702 [Oryza sativa Japonica Group]
MTMAECLVQSAPCTASMIFCSLSSTQLVTVAEDEKIEVVVYWSSCMISQIVNNNVLQKEH